MSLSHGHGAASGEFTDPGRPVFAPLGPAPRLVPGVESFGEYQGSGLTEDTYLVRKPGGQVVQVSWLLYLVLSGVDGRRSISDIAARATAAFGRTVSADNVEYLLDHKIAPLGLLASAGGDPGSAGPAHDQAILTLKFRCTLVPESGVQFLARLFRPLFTPVVVVVAMYSLLAADTWLLRVARLGAAFQYVLLHPLVMLLVLGLSVLSLLFHECGHAAACRYGGARPGVIGMGIYLIWPAFFTNVTDVYRLGRAGRIRTDLGGVYFNALFALGLTAIYLDTGFSPLLVAVVVVHAEIIQQLLPSLRFDGYFILADLIGVPDLFRRIVPTLRSMIPGQPVDPRVQGLKRAARVTLTAWVLAVVPLLITELGLIVLNAPSMASTFARSLAAQVAILTAQFGRAEIPAGLVSVISIVLLVLPMAGLCYVLLLTGRQALRAVIAVNRRRPVLRLPSVAMALILIAALAAYWGLLPPTAGRTVARPSAAARVTVQRPVRDPIQRPARVPIQGPARSPAPAAPRHLTQHPGSVVLAPLSASGFDPLNSPGSDPTDENSDLADYAIDQDPATAWSTQYYVGSPAFGGLKAGSGLILDMGRPVRLSSVTVTFGQVPGADVAIEVGSDDVLAASTLSSFSTVATAEGVGGRHAFRAVRSAWGRYVLIWFIKLPPAGLGKFQAQIFGVTVRGTAEPR